MAKLKKVQIARKGTWTATNGKSRSFGDSEFAEIVANFNAHSRQGSGNFAQLAPAVISHDLIATANSDLDKEAVHGVITDVSVDGEYLIADVDNVPEETAAAMRENRLLSVSAEFYPKAPFPGAGGMAIRRLAYLGATPPAVKGLNPNGLACTVMACSESGSVLRVDKVGDVWSFCEVEMLDRPNVIERLIASGMSDEMANSFSDDQLRALTAMDLKSFVASLHSGEKTMPESKKEEPVGSIAKAEEKLAPMAFSEADMKKIVDAVVSKVTAETAKVREDAAAAIAEAKALAFGERVDAFVAKALSEGRITPAEANGSDKTPSLKAKLVAANAVNVEGFGEKTLADTLMDDIRARAPKFDEKMKGNATPAAGDEVIGFCEQHSETILKMESGSGRTVAQVAEWAKGLPRERLEAWKASIARCNS